MHTFPLKTQPGSFNEPLASRAPSVFSRLSPASQHALVTSFKPDAFPTRDGDTAVMQFQDPAFVMLRACHDGLLDVVVELLDLGQSPTVVGGGRGMSYHSRETIPLAWVARHNFAVDDKCDGAMRIADLLLSRGANPNYVSEGNHVESDVSAMHAACCTPWLLKKLIDHGGDVRLSTSEGWTILDHWRWYMHSPEKDRLAPGLEGLDILVQHGMPLAQKDGSSFLASCWGSGILRQQIPAFIEKGFDPYERGTAKGAAGSSLMEHLTRKVKAGKGGALAAKLVAGFHAKALSDATPQARATTSSPRL